jgi:hypothetical protein
VLGKMGTRGRGVSLGRGRAENPVGKRGVSRFPLGDRYLRSRKSRAATTLSLRPAVSMAEAAPT